MVIKYAPANSIKHNCSKKKIAKIMTLITKHNYSWEWVFKFDWNEFGKRYKIN